MTIANILFVDDEVSFVETMVERLTIRDLETYLPLTGRSLGAA